MIKFEKKDKKDFIFYTPIMRKNVLMNARLCIYSFVFIITISWIMLIIHCEPTDWEYEYYYYVKVSDSSGTPYNIQVPVPSLKYMTNQLKPKLEHLKLFSDSLKIEKGNCYFEVVESDNSLFLQVKECSSAIVSSSFKLWDEALGISLTKKSNRFTLINENNSNVKIFVECRGVKKTEELETWDLFYSATLDTSSYPIILTKKSWRNHLPDEYLIPLKEGWHKYHICKGEIEIK